MAYKHGIYISEENTSIIAPVSVESAMPVFFVTAPVNLANDPYGVTNVPILCNSYKEAVTAFGYNNKKESWEKYTSNEVISAMFNLYNVAPCVIINILDPNKHKESGEETVTLNNKSTIIEKDGILLDSVKIEGFEASKDFTAAFNDDEYVVINALSDNMTGELKVTYSFISPEKVTTNDVIGGYDDETGKNEGLELISEIFSRFRLVPCQIVVPEFSKSATVATVMEAKSKNINGCFNAIAIADLPTIDGENGKIKYSDIASWKEKNNYTGENLIACYPETTLDGYKYHLSVQLAGCIMTVDYNNNSTPHVSPSNQKLQINGLCYSNGDEFILPKEQADYLNGNGIVTAINFTNGWTAWGNRTAIYPASTDVKDCFISVKRMFYWLGNNIILNYLSKVDYPMTNRTIETIVDSISMWLNGLSSREVILGGVVSFDDSENPTTDLIDGIIHLRIKFAPPVPMRDVEFTLEYDPSYLSALFS